jgi:hypothetical protein
VDVGASFGVCSVCPSLLFVFPFIIIFYLIISFENINGICILKTCLARSYNYTAAFVCGSATDCVFDGTGCALSCGPYATVGNRGLFLIFKVI